MIFKNETIEELRKKNRQQILDDIDRDIAAMDEFIYGIVRDVYKLVAEHEAKYNPNHHLQSRVPRGHPDGGQWTGEGGGESFNIADNRSNNRTGSTNSNISDSAANKPSNVKIPNTWGGNPI